jgi:sugar-specific transcriptional regulator TrmB/DNA-binding CsgD family transcriptional regulator
VGLRDLGFDEVAERTYRAALDEPALGTSGLVERLRLSKEELADAVERLVALGVVRVADDHPAGFELVNPTSAVGALIEEAEEDLLRRQRRVTAARSELSELARRFERPVGTVGADEPDIQRLEDLGAVREALQELSFFTRSSVYAVQPGGPQTAAALAASKPLDMRGLRRGLDMRVIYDVAVLDDEVNRAYLRELSEAGAQYRVSGQALERMIIMDSRVAVVPIDPADSKRGALVVRQAGLITGFLRLFERMWAEADALPWEKDASVEGEELTEEDKAVLRHLASGGTDETGARALGMSVRNLRRRVAKLMDRLEAESRFEAGVAAARKGWI